SDARRPDSIEYSTPEMDARRRDFTINALFLDPMAGGPDGEVIDFVDGRRDIEARILRAVGDPEHRLQEDHLRALRAVRFAARYG
ncbi:MAG TPA: tRNA nucleotidyltransferase, partial [Phycisphaerales bacterium]|nr:tRNA nucleotidyltransferase [Phycisphaerales bacterium]